MKRQIYKLKDTAQTDYTTLDPQNLHSLINLNYLHLNNNQLTTADYRQPRQSNRDKF